MDVASIQRYILGVCSAASELHERKLVHRYVHICVQLLISDIFLDHQYM